MFFSPNIWRTFEYVCWWSHRVLSFYFESPTQYGKERIGGKGPQNLPICLDPKKITGNITKTPLLLTSWSPSLQIFNFQPSTFSPFPLRKYKWRSFTLQYLVTSKPTMQNNAQVCGQYFKPKNCSSSLSRTWTFTVPNIQFTIQKRKRYLEPIVFFYLRVLWTRLLHSQLACRTSPLLRYRHSSPGVKP